MSLETLIYTFKREIFTGISLSLYLELLMAKNDNNKNTVCRILHSDSFSIMYCHK